MRLLYIGKARGDAAVTGVRRRAPKSRAMHAAMVIAVGFALIILAGALLLMLPCAAKSGRATPFIDALFTATSAVCVTGQVLVDTGMHWSLFGQVVLIAAIQIGGLGVMTLLALVSMAIIVAANIWGRGMVKIVPILLGVVVSYAVAAALGEVDFSGVAAAPWVGLPIVWDNTVFALFGPQFDSGLATTAIITIMPLAFATMIEHIGDISAIGSTCECNYIADPGLHRTLLGDGLATILASLFGAPANTTYGENTGVLALTRVFDPRVIRIAACCAIVLSFCPKFAAVIAAMPACVIGGVSLVLYGMISAVGVRNLIENQVDFQNNRNVLVAALVLVLSLGIAYSTAGAIVLELGGVTISLSGIAVGSLVGIVLNAILPGNDFEFDVSELEEAAE